MGLTSILRAFAAMLLFISMGMLAPLVLAIVGGEANAGPFLFGVIGTLIAGSGAWAASIGLRPRADFRGALIIILLWWTIIPAFAAVPLALESGNFGNAYFDAIAAVTTTGGWLSPSAASASSAALLWRIELQWVGGFASIAIAAAIFIRPTFIGIDTLMPPFSRGEEDNFLRPLRNALYAFAPVYIVITFFAAALLTASGINGFEAVLMAMSGIASGGYLPGEGVPGVFTRYTLFVLFILMIFSGANFVVIARIFRGAKERVRDIETGTYLAMLAFVSVFFWVLAGAGDVDLIFLQAFNAVSMLSTSGFVLGEAPPLSALLVTAMIGGAAVSTAGGLKILRWLVIMRRGREELRRLVDPRAVFGHRQVSNELGVWIHFLVFTMTLAALVIVLAIGNHPFELAATAAVSAIANAGPLIYLVVEEGQGYAAIAEPYRWALAAAMVLGRLEAAVALALINRWFWRA